MVAHKLYLSSFTLFCYKLNIIPLLTQNVLKQSKSNTILYSRRMENRVSRMEIDKLKALRSRKIQKPTKDNHEERKKLTRIALELIVAADKLLSEEKYKMAKKPLLFAADTLLSIRDTNNTVNTLTTVCFDYIAHASQKEEENRNRTIEHSEEHTQRRNSVDSVMRVDFSKQKGVFVFNKQDKRTAPPHLKFYVCKLNSILFAYNNMKAENSLFAMLRIYNLPIVLILLLICFLLIIEFSTLMVIQSAQSSFVSVQNLPVIISSVLFLVPLLLIYFKQPQTHNFSFFQMKLGQQIQAINNDCEARRLNVKFELGTVASTSQKQIGYALNIIFGGKNQNRTNKNNNQRAYGNSIK